MSVDTDIKLCLHTLNTGGLILYPTDTIWGIGCDATNTAAIDKIYQLKKRSDKKSLVILVADEEAISSYVTQTNLSIFDYIKGLNKPTTVIYEGPRGLPPNLIAGDNTIAIRIVKDDFCQQLIKRFGRPIVSTSANISGYLSPVNFMDIDVVIKDGVDYVVQHRQDETMHCSPSTIIKGNADGSFIIVRA